MGCVRSRELEDVAGAARAARTKLNISKHIGARYRIHDTQNSHSKPSRDIFALAHIMSNTEDKETASSRPAKRSRIENGNESVCSSSSGSSSKLTFSVEHQVSRKRRGQQFDKEGKFRGCIVWLTGLSGAGKSTIAMSVEKQLVSRGFHCYCLDGDNIRSGLCKGLGFTEKDREENIRRTAEVAKILADAGLIVLCSLVSPLRKQRALAREIATSANFPFVETWINTPLEECERRDTKNLYKRARAGELPGFTGIGQPYEEPLEPEISVSTVGRAIKDSVGDVISYLEDKNMIPETDVDIAVANGDEPALIFPAGHMQSLQSKSLTFAVEHQVSRKTRGQLFDKEGKFRGCIVWLTGLSGAGKSTIAMSVEKDLVSRGLHCYCLDGDNIRSGLSNNLGFPEDDRRENIRRTVEVAKILADAGLIALCSLVSPLRKHRDMAREIATEAKIPFIESWVNTPLEECERRDTKNLYKRARSGELKEFTGITQPYEEPLHPEITVATVGRAIKDSVSDIIHFMEKKKMIPKASTNGVRAAADEVVRELFVPANRVEAVRAEAELLPKIELTTVDLQWVQVLSEGWARPLTGFMRKDEYWQCLHHRIVNGINQSIPIVLAITSDQKVALEGSHSVALTYDRDVAAVLKNIDIFKHSKEQRICLQFACSVPDHPYIKQINASGDWLIGGDLEVLKRIKWNDGLDQFRLTPNELRSRFRELKADAVYGFQLRNPVHNGHALLMTDCQEQLRGKGHQKPVLLLHPLGGWTKSDDVPLNVRMEQHEAILKEGVLDPTSTVLAIFPSPMMYAGPIEVQWHAKARMVAGANYFIVGRDPAGIKHPGNPNEDLYDPELGARLLAKAPGLDDLEIIPFRVAAYDKTARRMSFFDPKRAKDFDFISGTRMRTLAREGQTPPDGFMPQKAWEVLASFYNSLPSEPN